MPQVSVPISRCGYLHPSIAVSVDFNNGGYLHPHSANSLREKCVFYLHLACFVELRELAGCTHFGPKWPLCAQKWQPCPAAHGTTLLITCLGPSKLQSACGHAPPLGFFQNVMSPTAENVFHKKGRDSPKIQNRALGAANWPIKK